MSRPGRRRQPGLTQGLPCLAGVAGLARGPAVDSCARPGDDVQPLERDIRSGALVAPELLGCLVEPFERGVDRAKLAGMLQTLLHEAAAQSASTTTWITGVVVALACNLLNNLPAAFIAGSVAAGTHADPRMVDAILVGVDLGPNLSVTGSLATILWLAALRRDGVSVQGRDFLRVGAIVMPFALVLALAAVVLA